MDLEKAYNRMSWGFVEDTLREARLPIKMIEVIMNIIKSGRYRLLWNGEATDFIKSSRGLRQGDPFFPSSLCYA